MTLKFFSKSIADEDGEVKAKLEPMYTNIALVSALLLTMVSVVPGPHYELGDKLDDTISQETAKTIFSFMALACVSGFITSTILSAWMIALLSFATTDAQARRLMNHVGFVARVPLVMLIVTTFLWLMKLGWVVLTNVRIEAWIAMALGFGVIGSMWTVFLLAKTIQGFYLMKT